MGLSLDTGSRVARPIRLGMDKMNFRPLWTTLSEGFKSCQELMKCGCNVDKGCHGRCKCVKAGLHVQHIVNAMGIVNTPVAAKSTEGRT